MSNKIKLLTAAVTAALGMGFAGQAAATVYASSSLEITNLNIAFLDANNTPALTGVTVNSFTFTLTNTASLNGVPSISLASCSGSPSSNTCGSTSPILDAAAVNASGSSVIRTNNQTSGDGTFTHFALDSGNWSNSDSVIYTSELTNGSPTRTDQIAQTNITTATQGSANAQIQSVTGVTLSFTVSDPGPYSFSLAFAADNDMIAQILNDDGKTFSAQADTQLSVTLNQNTGGNAFVRWAPKGTTGNDCISVGLTCSEVNDSEDLNLNVGTTVNNTMTTYSYGPNAEGSVPFGILVTGLGQGTYTLTLSALTSVAANRVPEPATLALLGAGLAGLGFAGRRQRKQA
ncbi:MAG: EDSAP-1 family PEP-CTERM protein [Pseudomonadota bacterium]